MSSRRDPAAASDNLGHVLAAVNDELAAALRRADALRAEAEAAREAVQAAAEERLRFFQYANHDMRSPLAVLLGQVQIARRRLTRGEYSDIGTALEMMEAHVGRLIGLADRALRLTQTPGADTEPQFLDLSMVVTEAVSRFRDASPNHQVTADNIQRALRVKGDRRDLDTVLENLVWNAIKYSPHGGPITVSAEAADDSEVVVALVRVTDQGQGIPEVHRPLLFEPFYRAPGAGDAPGSGLGLAMCADILARHGGRIWLDASSEKGSTFAFAIPLASS